MADGALEVGATYAPATTGVHMWHEPAPARVAADLAAMRSAGLATARVHLAWDAFMPTHRQVSRRRIGDLEDLLDAARACGMAVVLVLFAQSIGDCVLLPRYAVDRRTRRLGVRVVCDTNVVPGGPRDLYADPLMLELAVTWLEALLDAFAGHPAVAAWDLGHDPATTVRPRRIAHLEGWAALLGGMVRARDERAVLTLGAADVVVARGVRLAAVASHVDALSLALPALPPPPLPADVSGATAADFVLQLGQRLAAGDAPPRALGAVAGVPTFAGEGEPPPGPASSPAAARPTPAWDVEPLAGDEARRQVDALVERLASAGAHGLWASAWSDLGPRLHGVAPYDRRPSLLRHGLVGVTGDAKPAAAPWTSLARREPAAAAPAPWPERLDVEDYYAALPGSAVDLFGAWREERGDRSSSMTET